MDSQEREMRYLAVEAHKLLNFLSSIKRNDIDVCLVPNISYGLVAISPILPLLRNDKYGIYPHKIGSSESHENPLIMSSQVSLPLEALTEDQPHFVIVDGTRNIGGDSRENHKYPDSQQGYLNGVVGLNDYITDKDEKSYLSLMGISQDHVKRLRDSSQYWTQRRILEVTLKDKQISSPYAFRYWNPAGLTLALLNHGIGCATNAKSFKVDDPSDVPPTVFFVNSVMPHKYHSASNRASWGKHRAAFFDDSDDVKRFKIQSDQRGVYFSLELGEQVQRIYEEMYGGTKSDKP